LSHVVALDEVRRHVDRALGVEPRGVQDLVAHRALDPAAAHAVLQRALERLVEIGAGRAGRLGARELVAGRALLGELLLAGDQVALVVIDAAAHAEGDRSTSEDRTDQRSHPHGAGTL
jgi:hypothetical protein